MSNLSDRKKNRIRSQTAAIVTCKTCGQRKAITSSGLLCLSGHGGIQKPIRHLLTDLTKAWPELVSICPADSLTAGGK